MKSLRDELELFVDEPGLTAQDAPIDIGNTGRARILPGSDVVARRPPRHDTAAVTWEALRSFSIERFVREMLKRSMRAIVKAGLRPC